MTLALILFKPRMDDKRRGTKLDDGSTFWLWQDFLTPFWCLSSLYLAPPVTMNKLMQQVIFPDGATRKREANGYFLSSVSDTIPRSNLKKWCNHLFVPDLRVCTRYTPLTNHIALIFGAGPPFFALGPRFINNSNKAEEKKGNAFPYTIGSTHHIKKTQASSTLYHGHAKLNSLNSASAIEKAGSGLRNWTMSYQSRGIECLYLPLRVG